MKTSQFFGMLIFVGLALAAHAEANSYTLGTYCDLLQNTQYNYRSNPGAVASLQADFDQHCNSVGARDSTRRFAGEVNPHIASNPSETRGDFEMKNIAESPTNQSELSGKYDQVRAAAGELFAECLARAGRSNDAPKSKFSEILNQLSGDETAVERGCQNIPAFSTAGNQALDATIQECSTIQKKCSQMVGGVEEYFREMRGAGVMTDAMKSQRSMAYNACNSMLESAKQTSMDVEQSRFQLDRACVQARERIAAAKIKPKDETIAHKAKKTETGTDNLWNQAAAAMPTLMNLYDQATAQGGAPSTDFANGMTNPTGAQPYSENSYTAPNILGAVKGVDGLTSKSGLEAGILDQDLDLTMPLEPGQRSQLGQMPQGKGGGIGVPQGSGAGAGRGGDARTRAGKVRGQGFETNIYGGAYAGGAGARSRSGDGYPDASVNRGLGRGQPRAVRNAAQVKAMNAQLQHGMRDLKRFLPAYNMGRRPTAATGPDGITGPHTNLFSKVSYRYRFVPLQIGPFAPSK